MKCPECGDINIQSSTHGYVCFECGSHFSIPHTTKQIGINHVIITQKK